MKVNRHAKIIELINRYHIETQEELAEYLNQAGFKVTQATVSRDIRDLKLTKIPSDNGKQRYALHQNAESGMSEKYIRVLKEGYLSMDMAQNIYTTVSEQLELAKAKVQEKTPAFTTIQSASVPVKHSDTPKIVILALFVFLAIAIRGAVLIYKNIDKFFVKQ